VEGVEDADRRVSRGTACFVGASDAATPRCSASPDLSEAGLNAARKRCALRTARVEVPIGSGHMVLQRVGSGQDVGPRRADCARRGAAKARPTAESENQSEPAPSIAASETVATDRRTVRLRQLAAGVRAKPPAAESGAGHPLRLLPWQMDADERFSLGFR